MKIICQELYLDWTSCASWEWVWPSTGGRTWCSARTRTAGRWSVWRWQASCTVLYCTVLYCSVLQGGGVCGHDGPPGHPADLQHHVLCSSHSYQVSLTKFRMKSTNSGFYFLPLIESTSQHRKSWTGILIDPCPRNRQKIYQIWRPSLMLPKNSYDLKIDQLSIFQIIPIPLIF